MEVKYKQSAQEINSNMQTLCRQLLPRCKFYESQYNADLIVADLKKNVGPDGIIDASVANLLAAVQRLVNAIDWEVSPPPKPPAAPPKLFQGWDGRIKSEMESINDGDRALQKELAEKGRAAANEREQKEILRILHAAEHLSKTAHRPSFAKASHLRDDLTLMLQKGLKNNITLKEAQSLLSQMQAYADDSKVHPVAGHLKQGW